MNPDRLLVVPYRTSYMPRNAWVGFPGLFTSWIHVVEISVVFTQDVELAKKMAEAWGEYAKEVRIGGPAFDDPGGEFFPGRYVRKGITITSRGCPFKCPWCHVPRREGKIREIGIHPGNVVQDNNLLACSKGHIRKVLEMLKTQTRIRLVGGLDARLVKDWFVEELRGLKIEEIWTACDSRDRLKDSLRFIRILSQGPSGFSRHKIRCYVLIGHGNETMDEAEGRLREVFHAGALPFAQVYDQNKDPGWRKFARTWQRPAATMAHMKNADE